MRLEVNRNQGTYSIEKQGGAMNKSLSAAITAMLLITSSAWAASPESQAIRPTGDNMPDASPTEQADKAGNRNAEDRREGQQGDRMREEHRRDGEQVRKDYRKDGDEMRREHREERKKMRDEHQGQQNGTQRRQDDENRERRGDNAPE